MSERNRSEGWTHAKLSGHSNEEIIASNLSLLKDYQDEFKARLKIDYAIEKVSVGGLFEANVLDVFGGKTKSKTDIVVTWSNKSATNLSIKKSSGGQVYLIGIERFINGYILQFNQSISEDVKRSIDLFFGGAKDIENILQKNINQKKSNDAIYLYELRKKRLTWESLIKYDKELSELLLDWFRQNIKNIALFCFQRGLVKNKENWADIIWYVNEVNEDISDKILKINEMVEEISSEKAKEAIEPGDRNGGTTIKLPFGFVQWHQSKIQFHHQQDVILKYCNSF